MKDFRHKKSRFKRNIRSLLYNYLLNKYCKDCVSVLDIGCGEGQFLDIAKEKGFIAKGIDLNKKNIRKGVMIMDFKDIKTNYDVFFSSQFIEHINHLEYFKTAQEYCNKVIITITMKPCDEFWDSPDHIRPFTSRTLKELHRTHGFKTELAICVGKNVIGVGVR